MVKTRGLDRVIEKLDNVPKLIGEMLKEQKKVNVFECGCALINLEVNA